MPSRVQFSRGEGGRVSVSASPGFQPLDDFLESDIGDDLSELRLVAEHARDCGPEPWGFGGNSCHVTISRENVHVENDFTGEQVTLPRSDFVQILDDYAHELSTAREAGG
ncbi:hypothetical protein [Actinophytocola sp.]|uniref:hypothetical protein n=1 Tax=Actinophytocola sp. TaxID=1872138 RepID=UPI002ED59EF2